MTLTPERLAELRALVADGYTMNSSVVVSLLDEIKRLSGDRCDVCDDDGLIYVVTGYEPDGREIEGAECCPLCEGTRSGVTTRIARERDAARKELEEARGLLAEAREVLHLVTYGGRRSIGASWSRVREVSEGAIAKIDALLSGTAKDGKP